MEPTELQRAMAEFGTQEITNAKLRGLFGCGQTRASELIRKWKRSDHLRDVPGKRNTYAFILSSPNTRDTGQLQPLCDHTQEAPQDVANNRAATDAATRHRSHPWPYALAGGGAGLTLAMACLVLGLVIGVRWPGPSQATTPATPTTDIPAMLATTRAEMASPTPQPTAAPSGPRLASAVIGCWQPGGFDCIAIGADTRYDALQRQGEYVRVGLPGGGLVWVAATDLAGIPAGLAEVPVATPTARVEVVVQERPVYVEVPPVVSEAVRESGAPAPVQEVLNPPPPEEPDPARAGGGNGVMSARPVPTMRPTADIRDADGNMPPLADGWQWVTEE